MTRKSFALDRLEVPRGLEELGDVVELHEVPYGVVRVEMSQDRGIERLLVKCLRLDGEYLTLEELDALPGRFTSAILRAQEAIYEVHQLRMKEAEAAPAPTEPEGAEGNV